MFDNYAVTVMIGDDPYTLGLFDTAGAMHSLSFGVDAEQGYVTPQQVKRITTVCVRYHIPKRTSSLSVSA